MKSAIVCFYEAYPPISGAAAVTFNLAKFLPGDRLLVQIGSSPGGAEVDGVRVITVGRSSENPLKKIAGLRARIAAIVREIAAFQPEHVILEGASWALYHLLLMRSIRKALPTANIVYHSHNVEYLLRRTRNGRALAGVTRWAEGRLLREADLSTSVSSIDQAHFAELYGVDTVVLPNGVDSERFSNVPPEIIGAIRAKYGLNEQTVLFSGFYAYPPNREAIDLLVRSIMPALRKRLPSSTLALTGGGAPYKEDWIRNLGPVPYGDLAGVVGACRVSAAPIFSGSGTRLKILEACAARVAVVATDKAAEGIGLRDREHLLISRDSQGFADAICELLENDPLRRRLLQAAWKKVVAEYSWNRIALSFTETLCNGPLPLPSESSRPARDRAPMIPETTSAHAGADH